jgi:hypothetical protein
MISPPRRYPWHTGGLEKKRHCTSRDQGVTIYYCSKLCIMYVLLITSQVFTIADCFSIKEVLGYLQSMYTGYYSSVQYLVITPVPIY